jgi:hypothetical protein
LAYEHLAFDQDLVVHFNLTSSVNKISGLTQ